MESPSSAVLVAFLLTGPVTVAATRAALAWLRHKQILDHPNERSSHSLPTPRGGGLAVTPVVLLAWAALGLAGQGRPGLPVVLGAGAVLLALSWQDDRGGLPAGLRLLAHLLAAAAGLAAMPADQLVFQGLLPWWLDRTVAVLAWTWFINLYNFMDGIDGITGVETATLGLGLAVLGLASGTAGPALGAAVAAAGLGFLVWNWPPARVFLGDAGSVPLGFMLGWLLLSTAAEGHWAAALILPGVYLADATLTLLRRAARGERIWQAHRQHFYQQAVQGGASHARVALLVLAADLGLVGLALVSPAHPWPALAAAALLVAALLTWLARLGRRKQGAKAQ
jgi:UDP-N-acetylmuramyl pentapeptide phosphotransferase/UDP-N-acetylglucosamine-1-phosphate transferase